MHPTDFFDVPLRIRKKRKLSVIMPFYNESKNIVRNALEVLRVLREYGFQSELVLVDDGSRDNGSDLLRKRFAGRRDVIVVRNDQNFGKGWAVKTGFEYCTGDFVLFLDSDLELSPRHLPNFFKVMIESNADAVIGSKIHPDSILDYPLKRRIVSFVYYSIVKLLFGLPVMDSQTGIKLFRRAALEKSLPKVLVKKFAFDIELLIILHRNGYRIASAPIELKFSRGKFGNIRFETFVRTFLDTMAVLYRDRILKFYRRPLGENRRYFYTLVVFPERYDAFEREALRRFLQINYDRYRVVLAGREDFGIRHPRLRFVHCDGPDERDRLRRVQERKAVRGDYAVFARLDCYPDGRFLYNTGRILSMKGIGGAGGYVVIRDHPSEFEKLSFSVIRSFFLNLNMVGRFQPMNFREVRELQFSGFFMKSDYFRSLRLDGTEGMKLEYVLSRHVLKHHAKLVYTPDIVLYKKFPGRPSDLFGWFRRDALSRARQLKAGGPFDKIRKFDDRKFVLSLALILFLALSAGLCGLLRSPLVLAPAALYYLTLFVTRIWLYGPRSGVRSFAYLTMAQVYYGFYFLAGLFRRPTRIDGPKQ